MHPALTYVDDMIITNDDIVEISSLQDALLVRFETQLSKILTESKKIYEIHHFF